MLLLHQHHRNLLSSTQYHPLCLLYCCLQDLLQAANTRSASFDEAITGHDVSRLMCPNSDLKMHLDFRDAKMRKQKNKQKRNTVIPIKKQTSKQGKHRHCMERNNTSLGQIAQQLEVWKPWLASPVLESLWVLSEMVYCLHPWVSPGMTIPSSTTSMWGCGREVHYPLTFK